MEYQTKAAVQSVGVVAQVAVIAVTSAKLFAGVDISADVAGLPHAVGNVVDAVTILGLQLTALWGRLRATKRIVSIFN